MSKILTGNELAYFVINKIGTPYVYGAKGADGPFTQAKLNWLAKAYPSTFTSSYMKKINNKRLVGKVCTDCSGLISWYTGNEIGSSQMYSTAMKRMPMSQLDRFPIGTVLWKQGHVGVYCGKDDKGNHICTEAKGIDYGTIGGAIDNPNRWKYGLLFKELTYAYPTIEPSGGHKEKNPYKEPTTLVKKGTKGEPARWVQWELVEAGFGIPFTYNGKAYGAVKIDGEIGPISDAAIRAFQKSCKITVDGKVGINTRKCLKAN